MSYHKSLQGVGWISLVPSGTYPDPVHLAEIESLDFNVSEDVQDLMDSTGDVIDTFITKRVIEGTITMKDFSGSLLALATRGVTITANRPLGYSYSATIPTTPFTVQAPITTPTRTFNTDLGVINLTLGKMMPRTDHADTPASGGYVVSATGLYTFHTDDAGDSIIINYRATPQTADGVTADIAASTTTTSTYYGLHCYQTAGAKPWGIYVPAAQISGLQAKFGKTSWADSTLTWKATKDSNNKFAYVYAAE